MLIFALALSLSLLAISQPPTPTVSAASQSTLGMFVGFDRGDRFAQIERDLGRPLDWVVTMLDSRSASAMKSSAWGQFANSSAYLPSSRIASTSWSRCPWRSAGAVRAKRDPVEPS